MYKYNLWLVVLSLKRLKLKYENLNSVNKEFKNILKKREMLSDTMGDDISDSWIRCISTGLRSI